MAQEENMNQEEQQQAAPEQQAQTENAESRKKGKAARKEAQKKESELQSQIEELTRKVEEEKADYVRLMAEFETFRRRTAEEKLALANSAAADTIKGMLPVLDDCERAMQMLASSSDEAAKEGTSLIYNKLMDYLKSRGLEAIDAKGKEFDTDFHEAVTQFPAPTEDMKGKVIDVVQTGYLLGGKILRYAKVVVGA
ncbi:MAG: nucleotide exchange factor GrpE [Bacteroidales bacterium]|nr:nucleotide exchange factor GrpE [Candidatus Cryptobacteroides choladohippi]